jgi:hypothetical protein
MTRRYTVRVVNESGDAASINVSDNDTSMAAGEIVPDGETATFTAAARCWLTVGRHVPGHFVDITHVPARIPLDFPDDRRELIVTLRGDGSTVIE